MGPLGGVRFSTGHLLSTNSSTSVTGGMEKNTHRKTSTPWLPLYNQTTLQARAYVRAGDTFSAVGLRTHERCGTRHSGKVQRLRVRNSISTKCYCSQEKMEQSARLKTSTPLHILYNRTTPRAHAYVQATDARKSWRGSKSRSTLFYEPFNFDKQQHLWSQVDGVGWKWSKVHT